MKKPGKASAGKANRKPASADEKADTSKRRRVRHHPLFGAMKGMTTIAPGVDLTEPAMPEWADIIDEKYGKES